MIRISKNTVLERTFVIVLSTLLIPLVLLYLIFGSHGLIDIFISILIFSINIIISYRLAFNDYDLWLDNVRGKIIIKQRAKVEEYTISDFCQFQLEYYGMYLSHTFRYYRLNINGKKYRIRYYTDRLDNINDLLDTKTMLKNLEDGIKKEIAVTNKVGYGK
jgi:hypothetical protein